MSEARRRAMFAFVLKGRAAAGVSVVANNFPLTMAKKVFYSLSLQLWPQRRLWRDSQNKSQGISGPRRSLKSGPMD